MDEHACSVSLPTWAAVVGYEEGDSAIISQMKCGYPRFVYHPYVIQLMDHFTRNNSSLTNEDCLVLPTQLAAERCKAFMEQALGSDKMRLEQHANLFVVFFPAQTSAGMEAKAYWQHTGELVTSRRAEMALRDLGLTVRHVTAAGTSHHAAHHLDPPVFYKLQQRIGHLTHTPPSTVHLVASGMASLFTALRAAQQRSMEQTGSGGTSIVFGFPYLDTLKMCSRREFCPGGVQFFGNGDNNDMLALEQWLEARPPRACSVLFTEIPSNPLLLTPNFNKLRQLATKHQFTLVVDDTIGNYANLKLFGPQGADVVCTSLTKLFSGRGDAMAGALVVNPNTTTGQQLLSSSTVLRDEGPSSTLFAADAWAIYHNSQDFEQRNTRINATAEQLADYLLDHASVAKVYYPKYTTHYPSLATQPTGYYGGLVSIVLGTHMCQRTFFDALDIAKGPSLGTNFTLMCPYTLLAHYHELDFCLTYNVEPNLLRLSVGLEDFAVLKAKFEQAFTTSKLHPPLPDASQQKQQYLQQQRRGYCTLMAKNNGSASKKRFLRFGLSMGLAVARRI